MKEDHMTVATTEPSGAVRDWASVYETEVFPFVARPSRYIDNEINSIHADGDDTRLRVVLVFPDAYEVGISHLGLKIIYAVINAIPGVVAERCYAPWIDAEQILREKHIPLCSLEHCRPLNAFDIIGFSIQYELCYTNLLNILDLGGVPLRSCDRHGKSLPLVLAGGTVYSPGVLEPFVDVFALGDGEETVRRVMAWFLEQKHGDQRVTVSSSMLADLVGTVPGLYAPCLYDTAIAGDDARRVCSSAVRQAGVPFPVEKQIVTDLTVSPAADTMLVPYCEAVHDRAQIEIMRGCVRGCRFCQAGMTTRPLREKPCRDVIKEAVAVIAKTGFEDITLTSLSSGDYSQIGQVLEALLIPCDPSLHKTAVSLPSLRVDSFDSSLADIISRVRRTGFTFAPEAGSERLRRVINKCLTREEILDTIRSVFNAGWNLIKVYFMIGLPTETMDDIEALIRLVNDMAGELRGSDNPRARMNISISTFIPKAFTPFQWAACACEEEIEEKQQYILRHMPRRVNVRFHSWSQSRLEAVFARGDRKLAAVVETAFNNGCRFDDWGEQFNRDAWRRAFETHGLDPDAYCAAIPEDTRLPWDVLDCGVTRGFLLQEWHKALREETTPYCRDGACASCGIQRRFICRQPHPV
jgi:radical SAM family uncharacterized protein